MREDEGKDEGVGIVTRVKAGRETACITTPIVYFAYVLPHHVNILLKLMK